MRFGTFLALFLCLFLGGISAHGVEYQVVVSQGLGSSVESAAQNAAENALRQVVGSFIDSSQAIQKKTEIAEGIRNETKNISSKTAQYSQGSIKNFEVLDSKEASGLWTVDAKVEVRVEDFRAYITKVAIGEAEVGMDVLAAMATEAKQKANINEMFIDALSKVNSGEVVEFKMGKPIRLNEYMRGESQDLEPLRRMLQHNPSWISKTLDRFGTYMENAGWNMSLGLAIPFSSTLNPDYVANLTQKLESTASSKMSGASLPEDTVFVGQFTMQIGPIPQLAAVDKIYDFYTLPISSVESFKSLKLNEPQVLTVTLLGEAAAVITQKQLPLEQGEWMKNKAGILTTDMFKSSFEWSSKPFNSDMRHLHGVLWPVKNGYLRVLRERRGVLFLELTPEQLILLKKIQLTYSQVNTSR